MQGDIYLANGGKKAWRLLPNPRHPPKNGYLYEIPFDDGQWELEGATSVQEVLANVTDFEIRAEYGGGLDTSRLDHVELTTTVVPPIPTSTPSP